MISETVSKKRRGRPRAWHSADPVENASTACAWVDVKTERGLQNKRLMMHAMSVIRSSWEPEFGWFYGLEPLAVEKLKTLRETPKLREMVFAELGRLEDPETIIAVAREVCRLPMRATSRHVVAIIKMIRFAKPASPEDEELVDALRTL